MKIEKVVMTKNPNTGKFELAKWVSPSEGYQTLVYFPDGSVRNPNSVKLETK